MLEVDENLEESNSN